MTIETSYASSAIGACLEAKKGTGETRSPSSTAITDPADDNNGDKSIITCNDDVGHESTDKDITLDELELKVVDHPLTYDKIKSSGLYTKAKANMQDGDFELALSKIESGINTVLEILPSRDELHESLAPLYYLYGTTLLYSVEESQDNAENSLVAATTTAATNQSDPSANGKSGVEPAREEMALPAADSSTEDLQIAWENLETSRRILNQIVSFDQGKKSCDDSMSKEMLLDLAQIHSRLGDLSRHNGHYESTIRDYEICCSQRRQCLGVDNNGIWDRRIADVEYCLGVAYLLRASEAEKNLLSQEESDASTTAEEQTGISATANVASKAPNDDNETNKPMLSPQEIQEMREKSMRHYLETGSIIGGIIGTLCGKIPADMGFVEDKQLLIDYNNEGKPLFLDDKKASSSTESPLNVKISLAFQTIRNRVSNLDPVEIEDAPKVEDLREMLDEVQETIDTCEKDREGLRDVTKMRKKAEEEVSKLGGGFKPSGTNLSSSHSLNNNKENTATGVITTIGFETKSSDTSPGMTTVGFGADSVMQPNSLPMKVVKKKKHKGTFVQGGVAEQGEPKRARTN